MIRPESAPPPGWGAKEKAPAPAPPPPARPWVTSAIVAINVLVFVAMVLTGVSMTSPDGWALVASGSNFGPYTLSGEPWRLLTGAFLHAGVLHLGMNMYVLWGAGRGAEHFYGRLAYAEIYLLAAIGGSAASVLYNPEVNSVGASGAVFGVVGAYLAHVIRNYGRIRKDARPRVLRSLAIFFVINLAIGFAIPQIDQAAHLGGLAAGMVGAFALVPKLGPTPTKPAPWRYAVPPVLTVLLVLVVVARGMSMR